MRIAIEESGNFGFPDGGRFEPHLAIALIGPDSAAPSVAATAKAIRRETGHDELKASKLKSKRLADAAGCIAELPLAAVVYAVDNEMMDRTFIAEFRLRQAIRIANVRDDLLRRREVRPGVLNEIDELLRVVGQAGVPGAMSHAEFVQYQAMPDLMVAAINRAVEVFQAPRWDTDHGVLAFIFDRKLPDRLNAGERYAHEQGMRIIGSNSRFEVALPEAWRQRPDHPFLRAFADDDPEHLSVNRMLADRRYVDSRSEDLLQLADLIVGVVRRAVIQPDPERAEDVHRALRRLRPVLDDGRGDLVRIFRLIGAREPNPERYRAVLGPRARASSSARRGPGGAVLLER